MPILLTPRRRSNRPACDDAHPVLARSRSAFQLHARSQKLAQPGDDHF